MAACNAMALVGTRQDGALPLLGRKRQVDLYRLRQPVAVRIFVSKEDLERFQHGAVLGRGLEVERTRHSEEHRAMTPIETPQQRQVVVAAVRGDRVAASQQLTDL